MQARKSIYVKKSVSPDNVQQDVRYLQILIFKSEADWAYAMFLKQRATQKQSKINPNRAKVHSLKRFKAAAKSA